jgi:hypothetical protein
MIQEKRKQMNSLWIDDMFAAAFTAQRTRLVSTKQVGTRTHFEFDNTAGRAEQAALDFINNPAVNLRDYLAALRELKSVAFAARSK